MDDAHVLEVLQSWRTDCEHLCMYGSHSDHLFAIVSVLSLFRAWKAIPVLCGVPAFIYGIFRWTGSKYGVRFGWKKKK